MSSPSQNAQVPVPEFVLRGHSAGVQCLDLFEASASQLELQRLRLRRLLLLLASGDGQGCVKVWDLETRRTLCSMDDAHSADGVLAVRFLGGDGRTLLTQGKDGLVKTWRWLDDGGDGDGDGGGGSAAELLNCVGTGAVSFCRVDVDMRRGLAVTPCGRSTSTLALWDLHTWKPLGSLDCGDDFGMVMVARLLDATSQDGEEEVPVRLLVGGEAGRVALYEVDVTVPSPVAATADADVDAGVGHIKATCIVDDVVHNEPVLGIALRAKIAAKSEGNELLGVAACAGRQLRTFRIRVAERSLNVENEVDLPAEGVSTVQSRDDSKLFVTGGWDNRIRVFAWKNRKPLAVIRQHSDSVQDIVMSSSHRGLVLAASKDSRISAYVLYPSHE